jgi:hypothetical protein
MAAMLTQVSPIPSSPGLTPPSTGARSSSTGLTTSSAGSAVVGGVDDTRPVDDDLVSFGVPAPDEDDAPPTATALPRPPPVGAPTGPGLVARCLRTLCLALRFPLPSAR